MSACYWADACGPAGSLWVLTPLDSSGTRLEIDGTDSVLSAKRVGGPAAPWHRRARDRDDTVITRARAHCLRDLEGQHQAVGEHLRESQVAGRRVGALTTSGIPAAQAALA